MGKIELPPICFVGCGKMGNVILDGMFSSPDTIQVSEIYACVVRSQSKDTLQKKYGKKVQVFCNDNGSGVSKAQIIFLCCKPYMVESILQDPAVSLHLQNKLLVSVCAGIKLDQLKSFSNEGAHIIRAMPNTPCQIQQGMSLISYLPGTPEANVSLIHSVFSTLGKCQLIDEKLFDAGTALCASGPAFVTLLIDGLADGGVMMGLPRQTAVEMAAQVLKGTAQMVQETGLHPAVLKDKVTTPAGCTIAGVLKLEDGNIRSTLARAVEEATKVAEALGKNK